MSMTFDFDAYVKEEKLVSMTRLELIMTVSSICLAMDHKKFKDPFMVGLLKPFGKRIVELLRVDGVLPLDDDVIQEFRRKGLL